MAESDQTELTAQPEHSAASSSASADREAGFRPGVAVELGQRAVEHLRGALTPESAADLIRRGVAPRDAVLMALHKTVGNGFVQQTMALLKSTESAAAAAEPRAHPGDEPGGGHRGDDLPAIDHGHEAIESLPVQRRATNAPTPGTTNATAQGSASDGVSGASEALPHLGMIQAAFGRHDVSGITAHVGGQAAVASERLGAEAYATGSRVAFRQAPDLHTAAHEAAHVVQQRSGVQLEGGLGEEGDAYERNADAVAEGVVQGRSVEKLLDGSSAVGRATHATPAIQRKLTVGSGTNHARTFGKYTELFDYIDSAKKLEPDDRPWWDEWNALASAKDVKTQSKRDAAIVDTVEGTWVVDENKAQEMGVSTKGAASCYYAAYLMVKAAMSDIDTQNPEDCADDAVIAVKQRARGWEETVQTCKDRGDHLAEQLTHRGVKNTMKWEYGWAQVNEVVARQIYLSAMTKLVDEAESDLTVAKIIAPMMTEDFVVKVLANSAIDDKYTTSGQAFDSAVHLGAGIAQQTLITTCHDVESTEEKMAERIPEVKRLILHEMTHVLQIRKYGGAGKPIEEGNLEERNQVDLAIKEIGNPGVLSRYGDCALTTAQVNAYQSISEKFSGHPGIAAAEVLSHVVEIRDAWGGVAAEPLIEQYLPRCNEVYRRVLH